MTGAKIPDNIPPFKEWVCRSIIVPNDPEWWSLVTGVLRLLSYGYYWDRDSGDFSAVVAAGNLLWSNWGDPDLCGAGSPEPGECDDFNLDSPMFDWSPGDPFRAVDYVPPGYTAPPFVKVGISIPFTGLEPGDVFTSILNMPNPDDTSHFPHLAFNVSGKGVIELHFIRFPSAGVVVWTVDNDILGAKWTDLNTTLESTEGGFNAESISEIEIGSTGEHRIDVTFIPTFSEDFPFFHFGGGLRKIVLCGFDKQTQISISESEYEMSICEQLRFQDGVLQGYCCGEWIAIAGQEGGTIPGSVVQPTGQSRPAAAQSKCFNIVLPANQVWQAPFSVLPGDIVTVSDVSGSWSSGGLTAWRKADGTVSIFGNSTGGGQYHDGSDPDAVEYHMQLIAQIGASYYPVDTPITVAGSGAQQLSLQANTDPLSAALGSLQLKVCIENGTSAPVATWCHLLDFTASDYGFTGYPEAWAPGGVAANWVSGSGWHSVSDGTFSAVEIESPVFAGTTIETIRVIYHVDTAMLGGIVTVNNNVTVYGALDPTVGDHDTTITSEVAAVTRVLAFISKTAGAADTNTVISQMIVTGTGVDPFGISNC